MDSSPAQPTQKDSGGVTSGQLLLLFGAAEIAIVYLLLAVESPLIVWANRAAESWGGRVALAGTGWLLISVVMIVVLSIAERRATRREAAVGPRHPPER